MAPKPAARKPAVRAKSLRPVAKAKPVARKLAPKAVAKKAAKAKVPVKAVAKKAKVAAKPVRRPVAKAAKPVKKPVAVKKAAPVAKKKPAPKPVAVKKSAAKALVIAKKPAPKAVPAPKAPPARKEPMQTAAVKPVETPTKPVPAPFVPVAAKPALKPGAKAPAKAPIRTALKAATRSRKSNAIPVTTIPRPESVPGTGSATVLQLHRPRVETPSANAIALAAATARLSARRVRDLLPVRLQTRRLVLRAPIRGDVPELVKLADNRAIAERLSRLPSPYTRADGIAFVEILSQRADERPYAITLEGVFIGVAGFSFPPNQAPELGYWLGEPHWGQGYMAEAVRALVDAAHATGEFRVIQARVFSDNDVSLHILEKVGFKRTQKAKVADGPHKDKTIVTLELEQPRWTLV